MRYVLCCTYRGLKTTMSGFLYADYYGRKHVGSIQALDSMSGIAGTVRTANSETPPPSVPLLLGASLVWPRDSSDALAAAAV
jgi:hypothetical protein